MNLFAITYTIVKRHALNRLRRLRRFRTEPGGVYIIHIFPVVGIARTPAHRIMSETKPWKVGGGQ
jgi:hypothetical protein